MAPRGENFNRSFLVGEELEAVSQTIIAAASGEPGYTVTTAGSGSIALVRKFTPGWAVAVGIIGLITTLIGVLVLLYKESETLTVTLAPLETGTRVTISGVGTPAVMRRLVSSLEALPELESGAVEAQGVAGDTTKVCPDCAETVKAAASVCRFCGHRFDPAA